MCSLTRRNIPWTELEKSIEVNWDPLKALDQMPGHTRADESQQGDCGQACMRFA